MKEDSSSSACLFNNAIVPSPGSINGSNLQFCGFGSGSGPVARPETRMLPANQPFGDFIVAPSFGGNFGAAPGFGGNFGAAPSSGGNFAAAPGFGGNFGTAPSSGGNFAAAPSFGGNFGFGSQPSVARPPAFPAGDSVFRQLSYSSEVKFSNNANTPSFGPVISQNTRSIQTISSSISVSTLAFGSSPFGASRPVFQTNGGVFQKKGGVFQTNGGVLKTNGGSEEQMEVDIPMEESSRIKKKGRRRNDVKPGGVFLPNPNGLPNCVICTEKERNVAFYPCGHLIVCENCAAALPNNCAMCKKSILKKMKVFIS